MNVSTMGQASRIDPESGSREVAEFLILGGTTVFSFVHLPAAATEAGVVICSPIHAEFIRNYRREVLIGRRLAALGIAVQRFHYRGQGNSGGNSSETTFDTMVEDAVAATEQLRAQTGLRNLAFFGARFGALIASSAAARDGSPIALWDPVLDPAVYFRDVYRARRVQAMRGGRSSRMPSMDFVEQLTVSGSVPVLGYTITRSLYESSRDRTLSLELGGSPRRAFVLRMGMDPRNDRPLEELMNRWRSAQCEVEDRLLAKREPWWFTAGEAAGAEAAEEAMELTVDWLIRVLTDKRRSA